MLRSVAENAEFKLKESNSAFVLMQYFGYLHRNPDEGPDHDMTGFKFILQLHLSWAATDEEAMTNAMTKWPNQALQRTRSSRSGCNRALSRAGSLSLGRWLVRLCALEPSILC